MFFHRVDDVGEDIARDAQLMELFECAQAPYIAAVIPKRLSRAMARRIRDYRFVTIFQHGFEHQNRTAVGYKDEFPSAGVGVRAQLADGRARLEDELDCKVDGYVPPWNRASRSTLLVLEELGFRWFSGHVRHRYETALLQLNVRIDPITRYQPLYMRPVVNLHLRLVFSLIVYQRVGIVFHTRIYPASYWKLIYGLARTTASLSCSPKDWQDLLASQNM
jgi:peptidoglycan/xylan/chitin deacetylase (PgdA/CDA1 family)